MAHSFGHNFSTLAMRVAFGGFMAYAHGWGKFQRLFGDAEIRFPDPLGVGATTSLALAASAELICAGLVVVGVLTRLNLVPLAFTMAIAAFVQHGSDPFADKEMALLYLVAYVAMIASGPGDWTLQRLIAPGLGKKKGWLGKVLV
jgi:putative oxidoreductase